MGWNVYGVCSNLASSGEPPLHHRTTLTTGMIERREFSAELVWSSSKIWLLKVIHVYGVGGSKKLRDAGSPPLETHPLHVLPWWIWSTSNYMGSSRGPPKFWEHWASRGVAEPLEGCPPRIAQSNLLLVKRYGCNYGDPAEKSELLLQPFEVTGNRTYYLWLSVSDPQ